MLLSFIFSSHVHAITITGSGTTTKNSTSQYTASGCNGAVTWGVTNPGASINPTSGVLTMSGGCGNVLVAARCSADGEIVTKSVRVTDAGQWVFKNRITYCGDLELAVLCDVIKGDTKEVYQGSQGWWSTTEPPCQQDPGGTCGIRMVYPCESTPNPNICFVIYNKRIYEWRCPSSSCSYNITPQAQETCGDLIDNNCNEQVDEGCGVCTDGETKACPYTGPSGTENKGECKAGTQTCSNGQWGACEGEVTPVDEVCGDNKDNNCDGNTDEGCVVCEDKDGDGYFAYDPIGCPAGNDCNDFEIEIHPGATESCNTIDDNCNGQKDETCMGGSCSNMSLGSTANPGSGNLYHDQTLFNTNTLGFTLSYNSIDNFGSPLGKGWTHNYNLLLFGGHAGSLGLKQGDGRIVYFRLDNGIYYPDTSSGEDSYISYNNGAYTLTEKGGTTYNFNTSGKLISIRDRNGNTTTLTYTGDPESSSGQALTGITDPSGRTIYITTGNGKITSITTPDNKIYRMTYSGDLLVSVTDPTGLIWQFAYDADGRMLTKTDPQGYVTTYAYDNEGRVTSSIDPEGKIKAISYPLPGGQEPSANTVTLTEKDGGVWTYGYDPLLNVTTSKTDPQGNTTAYTYDQYKDLISTREADGSITSYTYDEYGNMASVTDPIGNTTTYTYNEYGQVTSVADSENKVTAYAYDANGNLLSTTDPTGSTTQYQYDTKGNITALTNPNGQTTTFAYDQFNNMISVTDTTGAITRFSFDISGNMTSQTDPTGSIIRFEYNSLNQLVKITDSQGNITTYIYDANGNRTSVTDANGKTTFYEYNYKGQLIKVTDALGNVTQYMYGGTGCSSCGGGGDKLTSITDANGQTTMYLYDSLGRLIKETDSLGNIFAYSYDSKGNLTSKTDSKEDAINYAYDTLNRLAKKTYPDETIEEYRYDSKGNMTYAGNQYIAYNLAYDSKGRLIQVTDSNGKVIKYEYDSMGNRTKMITPEGKVITYKYDSNNRLIEISSDGQVFTFVYDKLGRRIKMVNPNGTYTTYSYDSNGRLTNLTHKASNGSVISSFAYTHDNVGNRLSKTEIDKKTAYTYDPLYRLTEALPTKLQGKDKTQINKAESFTYDPVGNRLTGPETKEFYSYNQGNQLTADRKNQYEYDSNGNLISKTGIDDDNKAKTWAYSYDYENRLVKVVKQGDDETVIVSFKYDPFGRRIEKKVEGNDGVKVYNYVYDNEDIILEYETKTDGKIETTKYTHGLGIDEPLAVEQKGDIYYYHADGLGSIIALTDSRQKVVQSYTYDSFGGMKQSGDKVKQPYTYTGREWDEEIGLYYYRTRYYDPIIGRFISFDPILHNASSSCSFKKVLSSPQKLNPFIYVLNNPSSLTDPYGESPWYGNYCGPGNNAPLQPIDDLDSACKVHDDCYSALGLSGKDVVVPPKDPNICDKQDECDDALCDSARNFSPKTFKQKLARGTVMKIFCD